MRIVIVPPRRSGFITWFRADSLTDSESLRDGRSGDRIPMGTNFPHPSKPALGPTQPTMEWVPGLFPKVKSTGAWRSTPTQSSTEIKERVKLTSTPLLGRHGLL